jgi:proline iminopeptidase
MLGIVASVLCLLSAVFVAHHLLTHGITPPIRDARGAVVPGSVASLEHIALGGVPQWVLIRGRSAKNPVVLFLHGGPGMPAMSLAHAWQRPLEDEFVMVQWDRLGAGKSYFGEIPTRYLTVRRLLDDIYELANFLRGRFAQDRIILVGHSWGSYLGMLAIRERPDLFRAYVGVGQVTGSARGDTLLAREQETSWWPLLRLGLRAPEYTLGDVLRIPKGLSLYARALQDDVPADTLRVNVTAVQVPVTFVAGRRDQITPSDLAERYLAALRAPQKSFVWFEASAHFPFLDEPEHFLAVMRRVAAETATAR